MSGGRLGTKHHLPRDPVPPAPRGTGGWQGWLVRTHPMVKPAGLHAPTHPATNSSPLTTSPVQFSSHPSTHPAKPTFHRSTWTSTSTHHPLTASFYETIHPLSPYLHTHPSIQTSSQLLMCHSCPIHLPAHPSIHPSTRPAADLVLIHTPFIYPTYT